MGLIFIYILFFAVGGTWAFRNPKLNYYRKIGLTLLLAAGFFLNAFSVVWCLLAGTGFILAVLGWREEKRLRTVH
jgi:hypothetical protein